MALSATLTPPLGPVRRLDDWAAEVRIVNDGDTTVELSTATMLAPVAFALADDAGRPVPAGPPPVPPADLEVARVALAPGAAMTLAFRGGDLTAETLAPGRYRVRFAGIAPPLPGAWSGVLTSAWVDLVIAP